MYGSFLWDHDPRLTALLRSGTPALFGVWHQDFVHTLGYLSRWNPARRTYVLASESRDGGLAATAAESMGFRRPIRGSSARGGTRALLALRRLLADDPAASLVVVCDGPRPPARVLQPGLVHLARASGRPLWFVRTSFAQRTELSRSWAKFHLPHLGARGAIRADGPHLLNPLDPIGPTREALEARLNELAASTDALCR